MPGTFQEDAERPPGESCGSESSNTGSFVAQVATRFNRSIAPLNMDDDTKLSAEKPHPFSFRFATAVDIKKTWEEIEVKKTRLQGFDALQIMSDLSLLEHAHISKEAILSCPIMDQVRDLQIHPNEKIAAKASVVLPRLESIISPKQDPQPEPTSNEGFWEKMIRHSGPSISTSQNIFDTPTLFRGGSVLAPKAMEQRSSVKSTIPDKDATSGLFGKTASDVSKPSDTKTPLDVWAKADINTYEDLVEYLNTSIELDERDIPLWRDDLGRLWKEVTSVINELYSNGSKDGKSLDKHQRNKEQSGSTLVGSMCVTLRKLLAVDEQNIAKQQTRMDEIKGGMQAMKAKLVSTEESLKNYSIKLSTIGEQLKKAEKLLKELEEENIELKKREKDIDRIMEEHAASLKEENQDLSLTKLTLGKKCEDLKVEVESLKSYEQGYIQIKQQLEELQTSYNDVVAEHDDLQQRLNDVETAGTDEPRPEPKPEPKPSSSTSTSAAPRRDNQNHTADTDRLDLVVNFWEKALKEKLASNDKTKTQISVLDAEIEKAQQALSLRLAPTTPAPTAPALATSIAPTALDVPPTPIFYKRGLLETVGRV
ncbi:predicted protein [Pyrenophora tritici-repentis Pt-1C-BFP]|uniref:Uncharacterized protein n=1 Tax=Pyrenophora tritici-repentis (strain Pt-1C-BFP) TaxID=426418 RepID=B2W7I3_PYRTR|nr:uncharacterized protein PTRG_05771 [Pyrenophora tritici-repentis Pt-1C-BFP]EDU48691.1 predicted protein [Pyrenophora tritici-repentis Pt-1C-BFP]